MKPMSRQLACALGALALAGASSAWAGDFYKQRNLVSDTGEIRAENRDPRLVNAWGLAFNSFGVAWVADNGTAKGNPTGTVF